MLAMLKLKRCEVCTMVHDFRAHHQCKKEFLCKVCSQHSIFRATGTLDRDFRWVCTKCEAVHIPLHMSWQTLFGFPSWINGKEWPRWNSIIMERAIKNEIS